MSENIVKCKDCKYYNEEYEVCTCIHWDLSEISYPKVSEDDFCSYGERGDNAEIYACV